MAKNRILMVEDDKSLSSGIAINLQYVGYDYVACFDGAEAAALVARDAKFDLALLDIMLPGIDGFELLEVMKRHSIPVIYMTAKTDSASEIKGLMDGAEDYLVKPFDVVTLLVRIEKVLQRLGKLNQVICYQDFVVDVDNRSIKRGDQEIDLKPLEFDVLVMLLRSKNRTVPRERLLNEIWGPDYFGGPRTVDVHIANIRKKLGPTVVIKSISKIGYRLEE